MPIRKSTLAVCISLAAAPAMAVPFSPLEARSMAMGGTGVAYGPASTAGLFNPALLAAQEKDAMVSVRILSVGVIVDDTEDVINAFDEMQNGSLSRAEDAVDSINASGGAALASNAQVLEFSAAASDVAKDLPGIGSRPVNLEVGGGVGVGVAGRNLGIGAHVAAQLSTGFVVNVSNNDVTALNTLSALAADGQFTAGEIVGNPQYFDNGELKPVADIMTSTASVVAAGIGEVGVSVAHEFVFDGQAVAIGITPKFLMVDTVHYNATIDSEEELADVIEDEKYRREYTDFNLDIGAVSAFGEEKQELRVGFVVKNLISQSYATATDSAGRSYEVSIKPQVRVGVSKRHDLFNAALDLDLTRNKSAGLVEDSQFLGIGGEFDMRFVQARLGFRHNLVSDGIKDMATAGFGLGPLDLTLMYADEHSMGFNLQFGFEI